MPSIQIDTKHPTRVVPIEGRQVIVKNLGSSAVFYKEEPAVSATNRQGELTTGQTVTVEGLPGLWFLAAESPSTLETEPLNLEAEALRALPKAVTANEAVIDICRPPVQRITG